jgi:hypothetical protein
MVVTSPSQIVALSVVRCGAAIGLQLGAERKSLALARNDAEVARSGEKMLW